MRIGLLCYLYSYCYLRFLHDLVVFAHQFNRTVWCKISKSFSYVVFLIITVLFLTELGFRVYFATLVGPRVLLYGTPAYRNRVAIDDRINDELKVIKDRASYRTVRGHELRQAGYSKYFPNEVKVDVDPETDIRFKVPINSRGFRGQDFSVDKPANVLRVVTLGASSTFGYYNRDETTYPVLLEESLNSNCDGGKRFEVINLGIPHLKASQIAALFFAEGAHLNPDVITFYEGTNDAAGLRGLAPSDPFWKSIKRYSLVIAFLADMQGQATMVLMPKDLEYEAIKKSQAFLRGVSEISSYAQEHDILFIVANQQKRSMLVPRSEIVGVSYEDEVAIVKQRMYDTGGLTKKERYFLVHDVMMRNLEAYASKEGIIFVDVISEMDSRRDHLVSPVHLTPQGNRIIADLLLQTIREASPCSIN